MEKFRYYVVYWSCPIASTVWAPSAQVIDRDTPIETADDITGIAASLSAQQQEVVCVTDWKRIQ